MTISPVYGTREFGDPSAGSGAGSGNGAPGRRTRLQRARRRLRRGLRAARASTCCTSPTVHYGSPDWIEIQARHLREHISVPYETWTSLERIDPSYATYFDHVIEQGGRHSDKLNHLAIEISHDASDEDLLMFLDGDAFPIADPMPLIADALAKAPLLAVRRAENAGDPQPHPCFCVTTVGSWRSLPGDWSKGHTWINSDGREGERRRREPAAPTRADEHALGAAAALQPRRSGPCLLRDLRRHRLPPRRRVSTRAAEPRERALRPQPRSAASDTRAASARWPRNSNERRAWERSINEQRERESERIRQKIAAGGSEWLAELM